MNLEVFVAILKCDVFLFVRVDIVYKGNGEICVFFDCKQVCFCNK